VKIKQIVMKKTRKHKKESGFTLLELTFSVVLFTIIIGGVVLFGVRTIQAHQRSQAMQQALENARFAIEFLNKTIRTSHTIHSDDMSFGNSSKIFIKDNAEDKSYCYKFDNNKLFKKEAVTSTEVNSCGEMPSTSSFYRVVGSEEINVSGGFFAKDTDVSGNERGLVRTVVELSYEGSATGSSPFEKSGDLVMQSTVSIRDYSFNFN
jgi:type II secretory pathway pseudopilin PulG